MQLHIAYSSHFIGAGVIAGGPYRAVESCNEAGATVPISNMLNALYVAMTPLTAASAPDVDKLLGLAKTTENIDDLSNIAKQRMYIFTGTKDTKVNQHVGRTAEAFYRGLGVKQSNMLFVDNIPAGHSIITQNPEDSPLDTNKPPYINRSTKIGPDGENVPIYDDVPAFTQSHDILDFIYQAEKPVPAATSPAGKLLCVEQRQYAETETGKASLARFAYAYIPSKVHAKEAEALGVHIAIHGCKQGYDFINYVNGLQDIQNQPPYGSRYITSTGYMEWAEANNVIILFPQVAGSDSAALQNPDGCWDWWGYAAEDTANPDYYSRDAVQIKTIYNMFAALTASDA
ncbi:MAG: hypothetical protein ACPGNV_14635 [Mangrovicoccus sp.]